MRAALVILCKGHCELCNNFTTLYMKQESLHSLDFIHGVINIIIVLIISTLLLQYYCSKCPHPRSNTTLFGQIVPIIVVIIVVTISPQ